MARIGAIIPAYDEGPRLGQVLDAVIRWPRLNHAVVVDDGSHDDTAIVARHYGLPVLQHPRNLGKGAALQTGLATMKDIDIVLFLDADLVGLRESHLEDLIRPILEDPAVGMTIGTFKKGRWQVDLQQRLFAILNGQRALTRSFLDQLPDLSWSRFGVEVLISNLAKKTNTPTKEVFLFGLTHVLKEEKFGFYRGFRARLQMYREALRAACIWEKMLNAEKNATTPSRGTAA